jgi:hypothetical protein
MKNPFMFYLTPISRRRSGNSGSALGTAKVLLSELAEHRIK